MARKKRSSTALKKAERRAAGMGSIDPTLNLGNNLTVKGFWKSINDLRQDLITYNTLLSSLDQLRNSLDEKETKLAQLSERMLASVGAKYGRDSAEYEMAGGSKRRPRRRNVVAVVAPEPPPEGTTPAMA